MTTSVHIIEPTLRDETGHCHSFVCSLLEAAPERDVTFHVWSHRDGAGLFTPSPWCVPHPHFSRIGRKPQAWGLYRRLLARGERLFVATARRTDLVLLHNGARDPIRETGRAMLYFHWYHASARRDAQVRRVAARHPGVEIVCPTATVATALEATGFRHVACIPYPFGRVSPLPAQPPDAPQRLLYAGAARAEKGFAAIVDLVAHLRDERSTMPVTVQCTGTHWGKLEPPIRPAVQRLKAMRHAPLHLVESTLDHHAYRALFHGAITLQPYDRTAFTDRVSGVTLDALAAGSPLVVPAGTWLARQVERFDAGIVLGGPMAPAAITAAVRRIRNEWIGYAHRAAEAGAQLAHEHDARALLDAIVAPAPAPAPAGSLADPVE